jgi:uncharacterized protein (TIGR03435 family)
VISIKVDRSDDRNATSVRLLPQSGTYVAQHQSVKLLIQQAYGLKPFQIEGGPKWTDFFSDETYDIEAKAAGPVTGNELMLMLQTLLEDRFGLTYRRNQRTLPVYAMVIAKPGVRGPNLLPPDPTDPRMYPVRGAGGRINAADATMRDLASYLSGFTGGRLVLDRTGLTDHFAFTLEWAPEAVLMPNGERKVLGSADGPTLFQALQEQLGLKLEPETGAVEVFVIDRVERPAEN